MQRREQKFFILSGTGSENNTYLNLGIKITMEGKQAMLHALIVLLYAVGIFHILYNVLRVQFRSYRLFFEKFRHLILSYDEAVCLVVRASRHVHQRVDVPLNLSFDVGVLNLVSTFERI